MLNTFTCLLLAMKIVDSMNALMEDPFSSPRELNQSRPSPALFATNLKKLRIRINEEESVGKKVADLRFLLNSTNHNLATNQGSIKSKSNFQIFSSEPQSHLFRLHPQTGVLRLAQRLDREQLCPTFRTCCVLDQTASEGQSFDLVDVDARLDNYLPRCRLKLTVRVDDNYASMIVVYIHVVDMNDNLPRWPKSAKIGETVIETDNYGTVKMTVKVSENSLLDDSVPLIPANDPDTTHHGISHYKLDPHLTEFDLAWGPTHHRQFNQPISGTLPRPLHSQGQHELRLKVKKSLDREVRSRYDLKLVAYDGQSERRNASIDLHVDVTDANDNSPIFEQKTYVVDLKENSKPFTPIIQVLARDADEGLNAAINYRFSSLTKPEIAKMFSLDETTGWIAVQWEIDFEVHKEIVLTVEAVDSGILPRSSTCVVELRILDANDNAPQIHLEPVFFDNVVLVPEHEPPGRLVAVITASDEDSGENGRLTCRLQPVTSWKFKSGNMGKLSAFLANPLHTLFELRQIHVPFLVMYKLSTTSAFDRELMRSILVGIFCHDYGDPSLNATSLIAVQISDINDHPPRFERSTIYVHVPEDLPVGSLVTTINATDKDSGENARLTYWVTGRDSAYFSISDSTGQLSLQQALDREKKSTLAICVHAKDHGQTSLNSSADIVVTLVDINDNAPKIDPLIEIQIYENHTTANRIGKLNASDSDQGVNAELNFAVIHCLALSNRTPSTPIFYPMKISYPKSTLLEDDSVERVELPNIFFIAKDGTIYMRQMKLDREIHSAYELTVRVFDNGSPSLTSTCIVIIEVLDVNDNSPLFSFPAIGNNTVYADRQINPGAVIARVLANDADLHDNGRVEYRLKPDQHQHIYKLFRLEADSGLLRVIESLSNYGCVETFDQLGRSTNSRSSQNAVSARGDKVGHLNDINHNCSQPSTLQSPNEAVRDSYNLLIMAYDHGEPQLYTSALLRILITDPSLEASFSTNQLKTARPPRSKDGRFPTTSSNANNKHGYNIFGRELSSVGLLLGSLVAVGLAICFVLLIVALTLHHRHQTQARRQQRVSTDLRRRSLTNGQIKYQSYSTYSPPVDLLVMSSTSPPTDRPPLHTMECMPTWERRVANSCRSPYSPSSTLGSERCNADESEVITSVSGSNSNCQHVYYSNGQILPL